ncbi:BadF/BadG/BcrA/BcrD ATPase family protein [Arthrobacter sp. fls2-241-R2A-200]|uniref:N-acetylglucosamine kinase n=1 Tax=Arthrobacter sp. fls2-241-R2A-200 TaxID=3040281 RepID=UPI00254FACF2|nr:BadF/BadG/BcrA/BcrD ATPase family protein [Arthrobacter sp. fls2-241-R2A-200]
MEASTSVVLVADIGKSRCRVELRRGHDLLAAADQHGFPGIHVDQGPALAFDLLLKTVALLAPALPLNSLAGIGAGVAGVEASTENSRELAALLAHHFRVPAAVLSDATAAHLGAFDGGTGTVLIVGTGAVAFRFDEPGLLHRADGWGPYLGDRGSGRWIGQQGLQAVLEAHDGGPATSLSAAAGALVESPDMLPGWLAAHENPYRAMARFAPQVLQAAEAGDGVARDIIGEACRILTRTVQRACGNQESPGHVALLGGVADSEFFAGLLQNSLSSAGIEVVTPLGDGLDGAALAAVRRGLIHERYIHRDGATGTN